MAQVPGIFNAAQYFGSTTPSKDQQNSFWDKQSGSHSAGSFNGSAAAVDPFMTNQEYFVDGWEDWPDTDEFLSNDSAPNQPKINSLNVGSEKLIVPARGDSQTSSSSEDSTLPGMDPELNAWVEEETTPYGHPSYNNTTLHGSGAAFFDGHFNGETNSAQQPDIMAQHDGRSYASVCQAGATVAPVQDTNSAWQQNYQGYWATTPSQQTFGAPEVPPEVADTQENTPTATSWSQEPELGSWSPVFNHNNRSFVNSQQEVPSSTSQPQQFAGPVQSEPWANSLQPSQELYAHVPQGEGNSSPAGFFGHEEEQLDSGWSALTETDIQQADLWGNLPDLHRPEEKKPLGQIPMMVKPFPENAVALEQSPSGVFQENVVAEPSEQHLMEQHPMYQSPSGVFKENVVAEPSEQHLMEQHPMYQSPSGFFQTHSATQPLVNEGHTMGQLTFQPNFNVEPMLNNPNDLTASTESPSVEPAHQESVRHVHLPPSQTDSIIKQSYYPEQMQPPSQLLTYAENEAWPSQQDLGLQEEKAATEEMRQPPQFEPTASNEVQSSQQAVQTTGLIHELETSVGAPRNLKFLGNEIAPPQMMQLNGHPRERLQQEVQKPGLISKQETSVGTPSHLLLGDNSTTTESSQTMQFNESPREPSQQDVLSTGLISEQKTSVWAPSNFLVGNDSATTESPEMLQPNLPPRATPEQSNTVTPVQPDSLRNVPGHYSATKEFSQTMQPNLLPRATPEQSVNTVTPVQPDSFRNAPGHYSVTTEFSQMPQPNLPPRATPEQSVNTVTHVQPHSLLNAPGHYGVTTEFSQMPQPNLPPRATPEQSVNTATPVQPDSFRNAPGHYSATKEFSQMPQPNLPPRATPEQSVNTVTPVQPHSLLNAPGHYSATKELSQTMQPNLLPRATPEQSVNTATPVQPDSFRNAPGHYSATKEFSQMPQPNLPPRATPEQSVNTVTPVQPHSLLNAPGHYSATKEFSQTMQPNLLPRATPEQSVNTVTPVQPDSFRNAPGHYSVTTEFSQTMQPNLPPRATPEQSVNTVTPVQPDSLRNAPGHYSVTPEFSQMQQPNLPPRATPEQSVNTATPVQPDSLRNVPGHYSATKEFSQTMQPNLPPRATPDQSVNTITPVQPDSLRNVPGQRSATTEFSQPPQLNIPPRATPKQSVNTVAPVQPGSLWNPGHDTATTKFSQPPQLNIPPRATPEQSVDADVEPDSPRDAHQVAFLQKQLAGKVPAASPRTSLWMNTGSALLPTPCVLAPAAIVTPVEDTSELRGNDQALPADKQASPSNVGTTPAVVAPAVATVAEVSQQIPAVPHTNEERNSVQEPPHTGVHGMPAVKQPTVAPKQEQKTELSNPNSLASLLQGGQTRPKKKTSQPSVAPSSYTDAVSSQTASNPPRASHPSNSFTDIPQSGPDVDQFPGRLEMLSSQNSSQQMENQSFGSVGRTEELQHSHGRDYDDPNSRSRPRSHDGSYYQDREDSYDRRDPYYHQDQKDSHDSQNRRDPYDHEPDRRDNERSYYDRREPERRSHDRRREYDRRDSDHNRRSYDNSREYDRQNYDGRDYGSRDTYDNQDSYHGHGHSARQGRRGYDDGRSSREDVYRGSYHSGRSTPSSLDRSSPAPYDYSGSPYASQQYGYSPYTDSQSMDLYQYQYMMYLYQFHPQHYEQYCAQIGYYSGAEYTPEQLAQYYGGYGYENAQPTEQAPVEEVPQPELERFTPLLYRVQHPLVHFSGGKLISLIGSEDSETPKCIIASVQMVFSTEEIEVIKLFPGPLSSQYSSRTEVMTFCEMRSSGTNSSADGVVKSLVWKILANLVKHNGAFVASDLAEVIMENWRSCNVPEKNEFLAAESQSPAEIDTSQHMTVFREMLLAGATKDALEYSMRYRLWGHAMILASKLDKKVQQDVSSRFLKTMTDFDPIRTVYDHLSGRQPVALMTPDDWQRSLAAMVANPPRQHPHSIKKNMMCLGDTLISNEQVWAAHLCYLLAGEKFGFPTEEKTKMAVIGIDHRDNMISGRHLPLENLQMMEVLEYACSLSNEEYFVPVLQSYKFIHANKLAEAGFTDEALHYAELICHTIIKHPTNVNITLVKNVRELTDRLQPDTQEAADLLEMLDKVLQTKESSSQISSSVTESESEVEEPLAESSTSFFSGYDPSTNTPKHQPEQIEDTQRQLSYTEPPVSAPPVYQEPTAVRDYHQDSWSAGMPAGDNQESWSGGIDAQAIQPELPPTMVPQVPEPAPQPPFFVPGPPITQPLPQQNELSETMDQQPFYGGQWSEGARFEESNWVEPPLPKEPEPPQKAETTPKPVEKKKKPEAKRGSPSGGWLSGLLSKVMPRGPNEMILPDDSKKSIYWDDDLKKWINTDQDEQEKAPPPPPPSDMQLGGGGPPMMPFGNVTPATSGTTTHSVGTPSFPSPAAPQQAIPGGIPAGMATPPSVSKFSRKAYGGGRLAKKYVDVLNLSGQTSNGPAMLPSSLLPTFPGPTSDFNPAALFVPSPVNAYSDDMNDSQTASEPVVANPGSRPSSRNDNEDGAEEESQVPDPPPQNAAPMFYDPSAFSQPKAQASPRKSRYPGQIRK